MCIRDRWEMLSRGLLGLPRYPLRALRAVPTAVPNLEESQLAAVPGVARLGRLAGRAEGLLRGDGNRVIRPTMRAPKTSFSGRLSAHRRYAFGQLELDRVKAVKNAHGCTVNDHHVVDRAPVGILDRLDAVEFQLAEGVAPVRGEPTAERGLRRAHSRPNHSVAVTPQQPFGPSGQSAQPGHSRHRGELALLQVGHRGGDRAQGAQRVARQAEQSAGQHLPPVSYTHLTLPTILRV